MNKVSPSVMCINTMELKEKIEALDKAHVDLYHIDIMDGHFVPNYCLNGNLMKDIASVSKTPMDVHMMVTNPTDFIDYFANCGARYITMHLEALEHPIRALKHVRELGCKSGIAINPATGLSSLHYLMDYIDLICIMTVDPGFAGQTLIPATIDKIREARQMINESGKNIEIMVDGQVKETTAPKLVKAGANLLVLGTSGLFNPYQPDEYPKAVQFYQNLN